MPRKSSHEDHHRPSHGSRPQPEATCTYLAALAISLGAEMVTFDQGFKSYTSHGLKLVLLIP